MDNAKLQTETAKLNAEALTPRADHWFAPFIAVGTFVASLAGLATGIIALLPCTGHR